MGRRVSENTNYLEHRGLVTDCHNGRLKISLLGSGCSACHKSLCMLGDSKAKEVEIHSPDASFITGEEVLVRINSSSGYKAVFLLYLLPFLLMLISIIVMQNVGYHESISGVISLFILIPYFLVVYSFRKRIASQCHIDVIKR
jgi:sigma-E factor negative regulatory protein RseC